MRRLALIHVGTVEELKGKLRGGRGEVETKILEIRDVGTCIPVLATAMAASSDEVEQWYLNRTGYPVERRLIMVTTMNQANSAYSAYKWSTSSRTMPTAHDYIERNWDSLKTGDVICVETILGERDTPKVSERFGG